MVSKRKDEAIIILENIVKFFNKMELMMLDGWIHVIGNKDDKKLVCDAYKTDKEFEKFKMLSCVGIKDEILMICKNKTFFRAFRSQFIGDNILDVYEVNFYDDMNDEHQVKSRCVTNPLFISDYVRGMLIRALLENNQKPTNIQDLIEHGMVTISPNLDPEKLPML